MGALLAVVRRAWTWLTDLEDDTTQPGLGWWTR